MNTQPTTTIRNSHVSDLDHRPDGKSTDCLPLLFSSTSLTTSTALAPFFGKDALKAGSGSYTIAVAILGCIQIICTDW